MILKSTALLALLSTATVLVGSAVAALDPIVIKARQELLGIVRGDQLIVPRAPSSFTKPTALNSSSKA